MNGHPQFDEDFDLLALDTMEGQERQALEAHLAGCPDCTRRVAEARGRLALLALIADTEKPPTRLREHLLRRVRGETAQPPRTRFASWLVPALAAVAVLFAVITGFLSSENRNLRRMLTETRDAGDVLRKSAARNQAIVDLLMAPDTAKVTLVSGAARPAPVGNVCRE